MGLPELAFLGRVTVPGAVRLFGHKHFPVLSCFPRQPRDGREEGVVVGFFCPLLLKRTKPSCRRAQVLGAAEKLQEDGVGEAAGHSWGISCTLELV